MGSNITNWFNAHPVLLGNAMTFMVVGALGICVYRMSKRMFWRNAFREIMSKKLVVASFTILCLYVAIALLDSVYFIGASLDNNGDPRLGKNGEVIKDPKGRSLLDHMLISLRFPKEEAYSAPLADKTFVPLTLTDDDGNALVDSNGRTRREPKPLSRPGRHFLGTDKIGVDCLYLGLKGIRTGIVIGAVTTLLVIPFALFFGIVSGYFGGWIDDIVQFIITVLSSIPSILLIMSFMLVFGQGLPQLCLAMAINSWTGLCRVLRAESMKLREMDYIQAGEAMGLSHWKIMLRHILPNVMHLVLITSILGFSGRVMAEAILTYIGVGVGGETISWGAMVNDAISELSRTPVIWWKLTAAFGFMFALVLPANLFGDAVRDALDPRLRKQ